jgi:hypothetical protein
MRSPRAGGSPSGLESPQDYPALDQLVVPDERRSRGSGDTPLALSRTRGFALSVIHPRRKVRLTPRVADVKKVALSPN